MEQIIKKHELTGKIIKSIGHGDNEFCIIFTDETFCIVQGCGWDFIDVELCPEKINLNPTLTRIPHLLKMGLISKKEAKKAKKEEEAKRAKIQKEKEYQIFMKLKEKFDKN